MDEFAAASVDRQGNVSFGRDENLWVEFYAKSVLMPFKSQEEGRPIFESADYVKIIQPGEKDQVNRAVSEFDKMRFARQWADYQSKREQGQNGTPLITLFPTDPHIVDMFAAKKVHTVEQLANLSEQGITAFGMGAREHVNRAQRLLEAAQGMAGAHKMEAELLKRDDKIAELENKLEHLMAAAEKRGKRAEA